MSKHYVIWDDYTDEFWCAFATREEAETYYEYSLEEEGQQKNFFTIIEINEDE